MKNHDGNPRSMKNKLRDIPSVELLLKYADLLIRNYGRPLTLNAMRITLDETRTRIQSDPQTILPSTNEILAQAESHLASWTQVNLRPVINATGVILHTNLGRAPVSIATLKAMNDAAANFTNLEFDLSNGKRGSRLTHAESLLQKLTGSESALIVNNNASAVLLVLSALANRKQVVIARSQMVEIGGGFRVPDVMKQSGAKLVEAGTTNKVKLSDYRSAINDKTALVMRAHRSNFKIVGFTEEPDFSDIIKEAHNAGVIVVDDLGSGALVDTSKYGLAHEPTVQESMAAEADIVCFSGDKLMGGPQAGIIVGKKALLDKIRKHPLARAVRADKVCLAGVAATLIHYLKDEAEKEIPVLQMMSLKADQIQKRAEVWRNAIGQGDVIKSDSTVGGGSLPEESIPTYVLALSIKSPDSFLKKLRSANPPLVARTSNNQVLLDPRTVFEDQDQILISIIRNSI